MKSPFSSIQFFATALLAAVFAFSAPIVCAAANPSGDPAPELVNTFNSVVDMVLGQSPDAITAKVPEIRAKMSDTFAIEAIVRRAFGKNWAKLTPTQQSEATDLLGRLVIRTYATQLSTGERPVIKIVSSKLIAPERWEVVSTASQQGKTVNVVYRFAPFDGKWKVYDVLAENVSVVGNYRQQFDEHFQSKSADDLLKILRDKLAAPVPTPTPAPQKANP
ncbi:MAG TPA: ABC transporter substrate-binding protein [Opitutaceae bacterium]